LETAFSIHGYSSPAFRYIPAEKRGMPLQSGLGCMVIRPEKYIPFTPKNAPKQSLPNEK